MQETLARFRDPELDLCSVLCQLIMDIHHVKLAAVASAIDELAPPPPPEG